MNSNDQFTKQTDLLKRQIDALESRLDQQSCTLSALWNAVRSSPGGEQLLLQIQKDARALYQTMELEHLISL